MVATMTVTPVTPGRCAADTEPRQRSKRFGDPGDNLERQSRLYKPNGKGHLRSRYSSALDSGYLSVSSRRDTSLQSSARSPGSPAASDHSSRLILQPDSSPISQEQLAAEVKRIYADLVMVEAICLNIDITQATDPKPASRSEQWQALIALHRTLLYEHHDFLLVTQHPSALSEIRDLGVKYNMPVRMWKYAIHAFLEVLRHRYPESQDHMLCFIYLAYQMMSVLLETVPTFYDTWITCLGDLARYRMAIEDEKLAHPCWAEAASRWYIAASSRHPIPGRLHHHLAILERRRFRRPVLYAKSSTCIRPLLSARDSLVTLCEPILPDCEIAHDVCSVGAIKCSSVTFNALLCFPGPANTAKTAMDGITNLWREGSSRVGSLYTCLGVSNVTALLELDSFTSVLWERCLNFLTDSVRSWGPLTRSTINDFHELELELSRATSRPLTVDSCFQYLNAVIRVSRMTNSVTDDGSLTSARTAGGFTPFSRSVQIESQQSQLFSKVAENLARPLAVDYALRGVVWTNYRVPADWFEQNVENDGRKVEGTRTHEETANPGLGLNLSFAGVIDRINRSCGSLNKKHNSRLKINKRTKKLNNLLKCSLLGICARLVSSIPITQAQGESIGSTALGLSLTSGRLNWHLEDPVQNAVSYGWRLVSPLLPLFPIGFGLVRVIRAARRSKDHIKQPIYIRNLGLAAASIIGAQQQLYNEIDHVKLFAGLCWLWFYCEYFTVCFRTVRPERQNQFITGTTTGTIVADLVIALWISSQSSGDRVEGSAKETVKLAVDIALFIAICLTWGLYEAWKPEQRRGIQHGQGFRGGLLLPI